MFRSLLKLFAPDAGPSVSSSLDEGFFYVTSNIYLGDGDSFTFAFIDPESKKDAGAVRLLGVGNGEITVMAREERKA